MGTLGSRGSGKISIVAWLACGHFRIVRQGLVVRCRFWHECLGFAAVGGGDLARALHTP
jgi:hypothetical protein